MLHGMTLTGEQWMPFAKNFADAHTVVVVDLPGHGGSSPFPEAFSFAETAELMHGLPDELGARQAYGIGHSAGGMTLLHMAAQQPQRIKAMVLVDAPHYLGEAARKIVLEDTWEKLDEGVQAWYRTLHPGGEEQAKRIYRQYNGFANNVGTPLSR
jgi:pimeloyl-ACP methyl ester carboxylesterase